MATAFRPSVSGDMLKIVNVNTEVRIESVLYELNLVPITIFVNVHVSPLCFYLSGHANHKLWCFRLCPHFQFSSLLFFVLLLLWLSVRVEINVLK